MKPTNNTARLAGAVYLLLVLTAPFSLLYVPNTLIVRGDATTTARNILANEMMFRLGIVGELSSAVITIFLVMILYRLLNGVDKMQGALMVILGAVVSAPITFLNVVHQIAALILLRGADFLTVFDKPQREALAMLFLRMHGQGQIVNQIFWGLWLFPFGFLVMRSRFLPRILGILLIVNGVAYVVVSLTALLAPDYLALMNKIVFPALLGEIWITLWLLIKGARVEPLAPDRAVAA